MGRDKQYRWGGNRVAKLPKFASIIVPVSCETFIAVNAKEGFLIPSVLSMGQYLYFFYGYKKLASTHIEINFRFRFCIIIHTIQYKSYNTYKSYKSYNTNLTYTYLTIQKIFFKMDFAPLG